MWYKRTGLWRHRVVLSGIVLGTLALVWGGDLAVSRLLPNFHTVREGVLYRSGQPRGIGLEMARMHGIRTLVNLRKPGRPGIAEEAAFAKEHGMTFVHIPLGKEAADIELAADEFMALVKDRSNWPILVHCSRGKERAGIMSAAFRIEEDGWSLDQTMDELFDLGLEPGAMPEAEVFVARLGNSDAVYDVRMTHGKQSDWLD